MPMAFLFVSDTAKTSCFVSTEGQLIYVADMFHHRLLTLSRHEEVISTLIRCQLEIMSHVSLTCIHVTDAGQVLLCGDGCHDVMQVKSDGCKRLAQVAKSMDCVWFPGATGFSNSRSSLNVAILRFLRILKTVWLLQCVELRVNNGLILFVCIFIFVFENTAFSLIYSFY